MTSTPSDISLSPRQLLKTDSLGRTIVPAALREQLLDCFDRSGMSGAEFAAFYNIKYTTFASWRQKRDRARRGETGQESSPRFIEVEFPAEPPTDSDGLVVALPGRASVRIEDAKGARLAAELLHALENISC
ncbi:MAG: hypothetical protein P5680_24960 [Limnospira sp. PMC 737.11]|uniref:IS66 family insertion sequence element accessory protein TnpA n=1 Tax=Limnospira sp. PMC 737.11 TaxID=2981095 RepID=UPI0028E0DC88|nr:hypothetical protein [Limnospira sp. PMC 737.11]MDT9277769.1 hypothetical protein [Limnospira sp. PMC 737.11]